MRRLFRNDQIRWEYDSESWTFTKVNLVKALKNIDRSINNSGEKTVSTIFLHVEHPDFFNSVKW